MKTFRWILAVIAALFILPASANAQAPLTLDLNWDFAASRLVPNVTAKLFTAEDLFGIRGFRPEIFSLLALDNENGAVGGGLRVTQPIAKNLDVTLGPWAVVREGARPRYGLFLGFSVR